MAARITITPEELRTSSTNFANKAGEIREILDYLRGEVDRLESTWEGAAQSQFFMTYEEMAKTMAQFPEVVDGITYGEDTAFCRRATQCGYEIWCEPTARIGHIAHVPIYPGEEPAT
jgi:WXG100 family type VII secretion target